MLPHFPGSSGTSRGAAARLDITCLVPAVQELFSAGIATSTRRTYRSGSSRYLQFCESFNVTPFPVSESGLSFFVAFLYRQGLSGGTVKSYLAAIRYVQISLGLGDPHTAAMPQLEYVVKGVKKKTAGRPARCRRPITPQILAMMKQVWEHEPDKFDAAMLCAAACMCFFGFLRSGEVVVPSVSEYDPAVHLSVGDVRVDSTSAPQYLEVRIKASKTDLFRKGVLVYLGRTDKELCPVAAVLSYMVLWGEAAGPFFWFSDGRYLSRERFVAQVQRAIRLAGVEPGGYSGHSFRIGVASTAALCGVQDSLIKTLGRWESAAYQLYIRTPRETLCAVARAMVPL